MFGRGTAGWGGRGQKVGVFPGPTAELPAATSQESDHSELGHSPVVRPPLLYSDCEPGSGSSGLPGLQHCQFELVLRRVGKKKPDCVILDYWRDVYLDGPIRVMSK